MSALPTRRRPCLLIGGAYISSANIDETVSAAKSAGATVMMEPMDVMTAGRMAVLQDPTGAFINVWQAKEHIGATVTGEPNTVGWNELNTRDTEAAKTFYTTVFGWIPKDSKVGHGYVEFENRGEMVAGMMGMTPEMADVPPHWLTYIIVESTDAAAEKAKVAGR